jgi:uncharacterized protein YgbK (DUF1537 family)
MARPSDAGDRSGGTTTLRLLADDLTGALDAGAEFASPAAPLPVFWPGALPDTLPGSAALDSGTREQGPEQAAAVVAGLAPMLAGAGIAYKKIDSLMRGASLAELAACFTAGGWPAAILAPAFPHQGRITKGGRQYAQDPNGDWTPAGPDLVAELRRHGVAAAHRADGRGLQPGINVFDADSDAALDAVVDQARDAGHLLWCGTGGLARALAPHDAAVAATLPRPILGLFGSDQPATQAQLQACGDYHLRLAATGAVDAGRVAHRLQHEGAALVSLDLPPGLTRDAAARQIADRLHRLCEALPPPATLLVAGGETLHGLCLALRATSLALHGRISPGLPRSVLCGGHWHGTVVVSKSGAFGPPALLRDLLTLNGFPAKRMN